jgi:carbamoyl-phosphate synthase large subunit
VVTKIPRFTFEKFPQANDTLTTQMKSVGEVMAIGRTFKESLGKALRSLEIGTFGLEPLKHMRRNPPDEEQIIGKLVTPNAERIWYLAESMRRGFTLERIFELTKIDPWFIDQIRQIVALEDEVREKLDLEDGFDPELFKRAKANGLSDKRIGLLLIEGDKLNAEKLQKGRNFSSAESQAAALIEDAENEVRHKRKKAGIRPVFKKVDTCAAEFEAFTPYLYSTYDEEDESDVSDRKKIIILGGGPNRIGQGIEFDYVCVHGCFALAEVGYETIMVNCNPETVSTDYDTSDRLYFEPLTIEDVLEIVEIEKPTGVIVQFGGQTPLNLSRKLEEAGVPIIGTSPDSIEKAEDRKIFAGVLEKLGLKQPPNGTAFSADQALEIAERIGYPTIVRPSFVLGGRAMVIVYDQESLADYMMQAVDASPERPILVDKYLEDAIEVDVDALCDGEKVVIGGIMEHIEEAGVHSGDSACSLPPFSLRPTVLDDIRRQSEALALELGVVGPMNVQYAVKDDEVYILEVNPRASRTLPFVSKAIGKPLAKFSARIMAGEKLADVGFDHELIPEHFCVKEAVFPFVKFPGVDPVLGPEMKSTGEVMGIAPDFAFAYAKSQLAAGNALPTDGTALVSVSDKDKDAVVEPIRHILAEGWRVLATKGTADFLAQRGLEVERIKKLKEGRPNLLDEIVDGRVDLIINTPKDSGSLADSYYIRREAVNRNIPYYTTMTGARAAINAISKIRQQAYGVRSLQEYHST